MSVDQEELPWFYAIWLHGQIYLKKQFFSDAVLFDFSYLAISLWDHMLIIEPVQG